MRNLLPTPEQTALYYKGLVEKLIRENERQFTFVALNDFHQELSNKETAQEQVAYCRLWIKVYTGGVAKV